MNGRTNTRGPQPGQNAPRVSLASATEAWGDDIEEWVITLAEACDRQSQSLVAKRLGYSGSVISSVIKRNYKGSYQMVEQAVRGALMNEKLDCPVLGEIGRHDCLSNQKKAATFNPTSSFRVQLYRACRGNCPFSRMNLAKEEQ